MTIIFIVLIAISLAFKYNLSLITDAKPPRQISPLTFHICSLYMCVCTVRTMIYENSLRDLVKSGRRERELPIDALVQKQMFDMCWRTWKQQERWRVVQGREVMREPFLFDLSNSEKSRTEAKMRWICEGKQVRKIKEYQCK